jgi:hypothetical protein
MTTNPLTQCLIDAIEKHCFVEEWQGIYDENNPLYAKEGVLIELKPTHLIEHLSFTNHIFAVQFHIFGDAHFIENASKDVKFILANNQYELPLRHQNSRFFASASIDYNTADDATIWAKMPFIWHINILKNTYESVDATIKIVA